MPLIWTDTLPGGISAPSQDAAMDSFTRKGLPQAGVSPDNGSRLLAVKKEKQLQMAHVEMDRHYAGNDGYEHDRHLNATLGNVHQDVKALFLNPKADARHKLAMLEMHHDHKFGQLKLEDKRLGKLPTSPPTTPEALAGLLAQLGIGEEVKKVTLKIAIHETFVATVKKTREPFLAIVTSALPNHKRILQDPSLNDQWRVGPQSPGLLVLFYRVTTKIEIRVHFQVQIEVAVEK
ncbi:hypothetical protein JCM10213_008057 [Rhodosporidiobolus nylandii]